MGGGGGVEGEGAEVVLMNCLRNTLIVPTHFFRFHSFFRPHPIPSARYEQITHLAHHTAITDPSDQILYEVKERKGEKSDEAKEGVQLLPAHHFVYFPFDYSVSGRSPRQEEATPSSKEGLVQ